MLVSYPLELHLLLPLHWLLLASSSAESTERCSSLGDEADADGLTWYEHRSIVVDFSITIRAGPGGASCNLSDNFRGIIFRNRD